MKKLIKKYNICTMPFFLRFTLSNIERLKSSVVTQISFKLNFINFLLNFIMHYKILKIFFKMYYILNFCVFLNKVEDVYHFLFFAQLVII